MASEHLVLIPSALISLSMAKKACIGAFLQGFDGNSSLQCGGEDRSLYVQAQMLELSARAEYFFSNNKVRPYGKLATMRAYWAGISFLPLAR